jgi:hypothetical protein
MSETTKAEGEGFYAAIEDSIEKFKKDPLNHNNIKLTNREHSQKISKHKFHAKPTNIDGIRFHSKKEAQYYGTLNLLKNSGEILFFLRQVPFHLPGNTKYLLDFLVFYANQDIEFVDVKGAKTSLSTTKIKQVEDLYGIFIKIV